MKPPIVYLAGPINGCNDDEANGWREGFMAKLPRCGFLNPMDRDYRGREDDCVEELVELDKRDIRDCNIFLAYHWKSSDGTSMEIHEAWLLKENRESGLPRDQRTPRIIVVIPEGQRISPWVRYHSDAIVPSLDDAALWIESNWKR